MKPRARRPSGSFLSSTPALLLAFSTLLLTGCNRAVSVPAEGVGVGAAALPALPSALVGTFTDDYDIRYTITPSLWFQHPNSRYQIVSVDSSAHYFIARNAGTNPSEPGLFTRIDWISLPDMAPYTWAFCLTTYDAPDADSARRVTSADVTTPRTGCKKFPFSRMKRE